MHKSIEKSYSGQPFAKKIIEVGAGNNEHLKFVNNKFEEYHATDIRIDHLQEALEKELKNWDRDSINQMYSFNQGLKKVYFNEIDACDLSFYKDSEFDRLIATCLILHLNNARQALNEWRRVVKHSGFISIYVHSEPGILLRIFRYLFTNLKAHFDGVNHLQFVYTEHLVHYLAIKHLVNEIFQKDQVTIRSYPLPYLSWNFSFWKIITVKVNKLN